MKKLLTVSDVSYSVPVKEQIYSRGKQKNILTKISFDIYEQEFFAISGPSGSGKSTLAKLIAGFIIPSSGKIDYTNIKKSDVQILFQNNVELINPNRKVNDILNESIKIAMKKKPANQIYKDDVLKILEIREEIFNKRGFQLSGGQRQKVGLARILFQSPKLLILDEPFASQDFEVIDKIKLLLLKLIKDYGISIMCISHVKQHFENFEGRILFLKNGNEMQIDSLSDISYN